jgi:hypothetical protein
MITESDDSQYASPYPEIDAITVDDIFEHNVIEAIQDRTRKLQYTKEHLLFTLYSFAKSINKPYMSDGENYYVGPPAPTTRLTTKAQRKTKWILIINTGPGNLKNIREAKNDMDTYGRRVRNNQRGKAIAKPTAEAKATNGNVYNI